MRFLQWALPQLHMRWPGFRKVRRQVCKRVDRRIRELGRADIDDYRAWLEDHSDEWARLDGLCRIRSRASIATRACLTPSQPLIFTRSFRSAAFLSKESSL